MVSCLSELVLFLSYRYKKSTLWDTLPKLAPLPWQRETQFIMLVIIHGNKLHDGDYFWLSLIPSTSCILGTIPP